MKRKLLIHCTALSILLFSCSSGLFNRGQKELDMGDYNGAVASFKQAIAKDPERAALWKYLGITYYRDSNYNEAVNALKQASLLNPDDGMTILYLGLSHERIGNLEEAAKLYRIYLSKNPDEKFADKIRHRAKYLTDESIKAEIKAIIADEKSIATKQIPANTLAVIGFNSGNLVPRYAPLARGLSELLVIDLNKISELRIVERLKLKAILDELEMGQSEYFDKSKAPRVGKLLGAAKVVSGQLSQPQESELKLESGIIGVADGFVDYPNDVDGRLDQFFRLEKELAGNILNVLGYKLTPEQQKELETLPTKSLLAFLSYCLGLEYVDQGMYALAEAQFEDALSEDPDFVLAKQAKADIAGLSNYDGHVEPIGQLDEMLLSFLSTGEIGIESGYGLRELQNILGFQPETGQDEGDNPFTQPVVGSGRVTVIGNFDE